MRAADLKTPAISSRTVIWSIFTPRTPSLFVPSESVVRLLVALGIANSPPTSDRLLTCDVRPALAPVLFGVFILGFLLPGIQLLSAALAKVIGTIIDIYNYAADLASL